MVEPYHRKAVLLDLIRRFNRGDLFKDDVQHLISCLRCINDDDCDTDQDFNLLCLSSLRQVIQKIAELQNTDKGLLLNEITSTGNSIPEIIITVLKTTSDKFVVYAAQKSLVAVVNTMNSKSVVDDVLAAVTKFFEKSSTTLELNVSMETLKSLLSCQHWEIVIQSVTELYPQISKILVKIPTTEDEKITFVTCLNLTAKCITILQKFNKYKKIDTLIKYVELESMDGVCIVNSFLLRNIFHFLCAVFPYSSFLSKKLTPGPGIIQLGNSLLKWIITRGIFQLPFDFHEGFGGNFHILHTHPESISSFYNNSVLRSLALLVTKVSAFILQYDTRDISEVTVACECLQQLNDAATKIGELESNKKDHWMKRKYYKGFDWITDMFSDEDDALFEGMLALLNIHLSKKRTELDVMVRPDSSPHRQFYQFLRMTGFDHSILIDLMTSPETCFLLYLTCYLKYTLVSWEEFTLTHKQIQWELSLCEGDLEQVMLSGNTDQGLTSNSSQGTDRAVHCSDEEQLCIAESVKHVNNHVQNSRAAGTTGCQESAVSREVRDVTADSDGREITEHRMHTSGGLDLLCLYDDTDSGEDSDVESTVSVDTAEEHVNLSLDDTMATLIRLRLKILSLSSVGLFPYDASPLINLIEKCEQLYEH